MPCIVKSILFWYREGKENPMFWEGDGGILLPCFKFPLHCSVFCLFLLLDRPGGRFGDWHLKSAKDFEDSFQWDTAGQRNIKTEVCVCLLLKKMASVLDCQTFPLPLKEYQYVAFFCMGLNCEKMWVPAVTDILYYKRGGDVLFSAAVYIVCLQVSVQ